MKKFNYGKAEADLYDSGCHDSEEIYGYRSEKGISDFMKENGLNPDKYYEDDNAGNSNGSNNNEGCFLTTACVEAKGLDDDCVELETLRSFRDHYVMSTSSGKSEIAHYYKIAPNIVSRINGCCDAKEIWANIYTELVAPAVDLIKAEDYEKAFLLYKNYTLALSDKYC